MICCCRNDFWGTSRNALACGVLGTCQSAHPLGSPIEENKEELFYNIKHNWLFREASITPVTMLTRRLHEVAKHTQLC